MVGPATPGAALRGGAVGWLGRSDLRLRILLVCDSLDIGGAERHVIGLAAAGRMGRRLPEVARVPTARVTPILNAIPLVGGLRGDADPLQRRFAPDDPVIGTVARLVPEKGVACFLLAAAAVLRELPRARFVVIGDGPLREGLVASVEKLGIGGRVCFLGARIDGPRLIAELDVLAVPSLSNEGTPLVTLEALSAGVPGVARPGGGNPPNGPRLAHLGPVAARRVGAPAAGALHQ